MCGCSKRPAFGSATKIQRLNGSFGLTTMKTRHVTIDGSELRFRFKGKSGQTHDILMKDTRLARIVRACQCIPGYELFQYQDESGEKSLGEVGRRECLFKRNQRWEFYGQRFSTWAGTCTAADYLRQSPPATTKTEFKRVTAEVVKLTAERLGNRAATCRKYYIHPAVFTAFESGILSKTFEKYGEAADHRKTNSSPGNRQYCIFSKPLRRFCRRSSR